MTSPAALSDNAFFRQLERQRLGCRLDVLRLECRYSVIDVPRTESDVVDRMTRARRGVACYREHPDATVIGVPTATTGRVRFWDPRKHWVCRSESDARLRMLPVGN